MWEGAHSSSSASDIYSSAWATEIWVYAFHRKSSKLKLSCCLVAYINPTGSEVTGKVEMEFKGELCGDERDGRDKGIEIWFY